MKKTITIIELLNYLIENASFDYPADFDRMEHHFDKSGNDADIKSCLTELLSEYQDRTLILGISLRAKDDGYYCDLPFGETDIALLRTMLLNLPYCERWQTDAIAQRLDGFLPIYKRDEERLIYTNSEKYSGTFYDNMTEIQKALYPLPDKQSDERHIRKITFEYCGYNEWLELEARASHFDGKILRTANPLKVICMNNFFYLVTFDFSEGKLNFINYRIDRMKNVKCTDIFSEKFEDTLSDNRKYVLELKRKIDEGKKRAAERNVFFHEPNDDISVLDEARKIDNNGFNLGEYINRSRNMYTDKVVDCVKAKITKELLCGIVDLYGFDIDVRPFDERNYLVSLHDISENTMIKWAMQYYENAEIIEPVELREKISCAITALAEKYGKAGDKK